MIKTEESTQVKENVSVELPGCIAYPAGSGCPIEWCRKARGDWCKDKHGMCKWKRI
ncbi:MAG: hypothetical protein ACD_75C00843G0004 [uncultured bacterium]|nr:MAG: hypothetical protein ACD_75C00843G0004 [uncultured bacterium]